MSQNIDNELIKILSVFPKKIDLKREIDTYLKF
jgi:hypothetical protein